MINFINKYFVSDLDVITITSFYGLSAPSQREINLRKKKIEKCKEILGDKYLLAKPIQRGSNATGN